MTPLLGALITVAGIILFSQRDDTKLHEKASGDSQNDALSVSAPPQLKETSTETDYSEDLGKSEDLSIRKELERGMLEDHSVKRHARLYNIVVQKRYLTYSDFELEVLLEGLMDTFYGNRDIGRSIRRVKIELIRRGHQDYLNEMKKDAASGSLETALDALEDLSTIASKEAIEVLVQALDEQRTEQVDDHNAYTRRSFAAYRLGLLYPDSPLGMVGILNLDQSIDDFKVWWAAKK